jgi:hypothetical protein
MKSRQEGPAKTEEVCMKMDTMVEGGGEGTAAEQALERFAEP